MCHMMTCSAGETCCFERVSEEMCSESACSDGETCSDLRGTGACGADSVGASESDDSEHVSEMLSESVQRFRGDAAVGA